MSAYDDFLNFFKMHNKERLDGLSESYFTAMTPDERTMAFNYLLNILQKGGTEESIHGLFMADESRAFEAISDLLKRGTLRDEAEIAAAWNLYRIIPDDALIKIFIRHFSNPVAEIRGKAAYYVPSQHLTEELKFGLRGMIRTETDTLALIHAVTKLLECYGVTRESVPKKEFSRYYIGLCSEEMHMKERTFKELDELVG
jgi:hypothetical protein